MKMIVSLFLVLSILMGSSISVFAQEKGSSSYTDKKQSEDTPVEVIAVDNRIKVTNAPIGSKLEIYSVVGIKVVEIEMKQPDGEYVVNIARGYYIIRIDETVRKVAIR